MVTVIIAFVAIAVLLGVYYVYDSNSEISMTMYKTPYCVCCDQYKLYLERNTYSVDVEIVDQSDFIMLKKKLGIPEDMWSCHTIIINDIGYVVEGHVPISSIVKMLSADSDRDIRGIALPGMPPGSPGMPGYSNKLVVYYFTETGEYDVFDVVYD